MPPDDGGRELVLPTHHVHRMGNGRRVGYALYGDPEGFPVVNCHGGLLSRNDVAPHHGEAVRLGVRLISIDRPGVALSDRDSGHAMCDWVANDLVSLLAELGVDRFSVMGWSLGGQYAVATASVLPERVVRVATLAGCPPLDPAGRRADLNPLDRHLAALSTGRPGAARLAFGVMHAAARYAPALVTRVVCANLPPHEAAAVRSEEGWFPRTMEEGVRNGLGMVDEYRAMVAPWGFDPASVTVPVDVHQGSADKLVPESWGRQLADLLGNATFHLHPGDGHLFALTRRADVLSTLREA
ncbi:MAG: alpha/beta fold hydrolase [Acidimicrobiales bacterium]